MAFREDSKRSVVKTITYRIVIALSTMVIVFLYTGDYALTMGVTLVVSIANTIIYYLHERFWNIIHWGKKQ